MDDEALEIIEEWIDSLDDPPSGTDIESAEPMLPQLATLHGNYPNPVRSSTNISYELAREGHVNVTLFDIQGRTVDVLVDAFQQSGQHSYTLDAGSLSQRYIHLST